ncbi:MAG: ATP-binding domain-containing protein [Alkalibacterium sp.]|nr:ATP-binding domain-containing protein [Alkalibacterium sp.]
MIDFDGNEVDYLRNEWNKITLSYCVALIHKSQGSEYPMVILPLVFGYGRMLKKDIVYTAITRAAQTLLICGEQAAFVRSVSENTTERLTSLAERIAGTSNEASLSVDKLEKMQSTEATEQLCAYPSQMSKQIRSIR